MSDTPRTPRDSVDNGPEDEERPKARRTKRMLLESYYGRGDATGAPDAAGSSQQTPGGVYPTPGAGEVGGDPLNIDGTCFDPDKWTQRLLRNETLAQLLERDKKLQSEIKELDSDMKMLVYENYNKFISATDTIRKMKENVAGIEGRMQELDAHTVAIAQCSEAITSSLSGKQARLEKLSNDHRLLKKLQWLVELPARLRGCLKAGTLAVAVDYWKRCLPALEDLRSDIQSVQKIYVECKSIVEGIHDTLVDKLKAIIAAGPQAIVQQQILAQAGKGKKKGAAFPDREIAEAAKLLVDIGGEDPEVIEFVKGLFFDCHRVAFEAILKTAPPPEAGVHAVAKALSEPFLFQVVSTYGSFRETFIGGEDPMLDDEFVMEGPHWASIQKFLGEVMDQYLKFLQHQIVGGVSTAPSEGETNATESSEEAEKKHQEEVEQVVVCLGLLYEQMSQIGRQLPFLHLADRAGDTVGNIVMFYIEAHFNKASALITSRIEELVQASRDPLIVASAIAKTQKQQQPPQPEESVSNPEESPSAGLDEQEPTDKIIKSEEIAIPEPEQIDTWWKSVSNTLAREVFEAIKRVLSDVSPLVQTDHKFMASQMLKVTSKTKIRTQQALLSLETDLIKLILSSEANPNSKPSIEAHSGQLILAMSYVCRAIASGVQGVADTANALFPSADADLDFQLINADDLKRRFMDLSGLLLDEFVETEGGILSSYVHAYLTTTSWVPRKSPRDIGEAAQLFAARLADLSRLTSMILPEPSSNSHQSASRDAPNTPLMVPPMKSSRDQLLLKSPRRGITPTETSSSHKLKNSSSMPSLATMGSPSPAAMATHVEFNRPSVMAAIIRVSLKALLECVRLSTLGRGGFSEIQVDKTFLQSAIIKAVSGGSFTATGPCAPLLARIDTLLEDIEVNAQQRCLDPQSDAGVHQFVFKTRPSPSPK